MRIKYIVRGREFDFRRFGDHIEEITLFRRWWVGGVLSRDWMGRIEYGLKNNNGDYFSVKCGRYIGPGQYTIKKHDYMRLSGTRLSMGGWDIFGDAVPAFDSFIHAARFLHENINNLI